jgi:hypothetical protein
MWRYDFDLFYRAGQAVLSGTNPYTIVDFNPPYFLAMLFAPFSLLPFDVAYWLFVIACVGLCWRVMKWRCIWPLLSFPGLFSLFVGQVDFLLALLLLQFGNWMLPLMLAKVQAGYVLVPWVIQRTPLRRLAILVGIGLGIILLSFLVRPTWFTEWRSITPDLTAYATRDSNLYWLVPADFKTIAVLIGSVIGLALAFYLKEQRDSYIAAHLFAPLTNIYSVAVLFQWIGPLEVLLSWVIIALVGTIHAGAPMFIIALSILGRYWLRSYLEKRQVSKRYLNLIAWVEPPKPSPSAAQS